MRNFLFIFSCIIMVNCQLKKVDQKAIINQIGSDNISVNDTLKVQFDKIVNKPFIKPITSKDLILLNFNSNQIKFLNNEHDPELIDTIKTYRLNDNVFTFYKTLNKEFLINFFINDSINFIKSDINIGSNKLIFNGDNLITATSQVIELYDEENMGGIIINIINGKIFSLKGNYIYD